MSFLDLTIRECVSQWQTAMAGIVKEGFQVLQNIEKYKPYFEDGQLSNRSTWMEGVNLFLQDVVAILKKDGRMVHFGISLVLIAIFLLFLKL